MKMLNAKELAKLTPSQLADYKANMLKEFETIDNEMANKRKAAFDKVAAFIDSLPKEIGALLGEDVTIEQVAGFIKQKIKGSLGTVVSVTNVNENRGRKLTDDVKIALSEAMAQRQADVKAGKTAEQLSKIAERFGVTPQTALAYGAKPFVKTVAATPAAAGSAA